MKVALINAPRPVFEGEGTHLFQPYLPLAISLLNGYLQGKKIDTRMIDLHTILMENKELFYSLNKIDGRFGVEEFILKNQSLIKRVVDYLISKINIEDCDILGISIIEKQSVKITLPFIRKIKEIYPNKKIVIGGEDNSIGEKEKAIDFIVNGEGEASFLSIIKGIQNKTNLPRYFHDHHVNPADQSVIFEGVHIDNCRQEDAIFYNDLFNAPLLPYQLGKGCFYRCSFCSLAASESSRKTPEQIVKDLKKIKEKFHYKYFYFLQEHLTISKSYINELCDRIIDSKLDILWSDNIKPMSYLSQDMYYKLRESGCIRLSYGVESGSPRIMKLMNKGHSVPDSEKNLRYAHKAGIFTEAGFIVGFPTEGEKEFNETLDFLKRSKNYLDITGLSIFRLHGESFVAKNPEKYGIRLKSEANWTTYVRANVHEYDEIGGLAYEKLQEIYQSRHKKFFKTWSSLKGKNDYSTYLRTMIYPLYDLFGSKDKVLGFLEENSDDILRRSQEGYHSLFTGVASNQRIKGNLQHCWTNKLKLVPFDTVVKRIQEIYGEGFTKLIITGGEPLIRKNIFKILSKAKEVGFEYIIVKTNARMLKYENFCERLSKYVDEILVINPSEDEKEYESISGVKGSYSQAVEGINNWKTLNKKIRCYLKEQL